MPTIAAGTSADTRLASTRAVATPTALKLAVQAALKVASSSEPAVGDAYFGDVAALLHLDGANNSTVITDVLGGTWVPAVNAKISTALSRWGGASCYFDGTSDTSALGTGSKITGPSGASISGTGDFTIEFWMRPTALVSAAGGSTARILYDQRPTTGLYPALWIDGVSLNRLSYFINGSRVLTGSTTLVANTWYHVALCRASGTTRLFVNGVLDGTWADTSNYIANAPVLGKVNVGNGFEYQGYLDDFRITKAARYTANFTPPAAAFPDRYAEPTSTEGVVSLLHFNNTAGSQTFSDVLLKNWAVYGNTFNSATQSKFGGISGYFDGSGDYLACASPDFGFGAGDWTWEGWVRPDAIAGGDPHFASVSSLMHFEGANNSTTFTDVAGRTWTASGDAKVVTSQFKWGASCAFFDVTGDAITATPNAAFSMGTGDFTFECWIRPDTIVAAWARLFENELFDVTGGWHLSFNGTDGVGVRRLGFQRGQNGGGGARIDTNAAIPVNVWTHIAAVRSSGVTSLYVNGVKQTATLVDAENYTSQKAVIGYAISGTAGYYSGFIDDLRLTKGVARYTTNFTPPAAAFPDVLGGGLTGVLFDTRAGGAAGLGIYALDSANSDKWGIKTNAGVTTGGSLLTGGTWTHLAVAKQGTTIRGFKDGVLDFTYTDARTYSLTALATVGANSSGAEFYKGYLDEMRVTKGVARYVSAFAAPTAAFVDPTISEGGSGGGGTPTPVTRSYGFVS